MSEMIERVAKAIFAVKAQKHTTWEQCDEAYRETKRSEARAAIEAMREPTMDMESAAANWQGGQMTYSDVWRAMIDAAPSSTERESP